MIREIKTYYIILCLCSLSFSQDNVDVVTKVATSAANWLKLETGTRAIGMGGAYTAAGDDVSGIPYNPASVSFVKGQEGFLSTTQYIAGISYNVLGYATNMSGVDYAGVHLFFLDSGSMDVTNEFYPDGTGETFSMTGLCVRGTYGRRVTNRLRIGFTGKYIREQIYTTHMQSFAFDIGSHFNTGLYGFVLGMSISNLGPEVKYEGDGLEIECEESPTGYCQQIAEPFSLPMTFRIGFANNIVGPESEFIKSKNHKFLISMDAINPIDFTLYGAMGMEYGFADMFFLRAGTHFGHDTADMSLGAGLQINSDEFSMGLDYAYVNYGILDYTHQFGLNFKF
tara:strand:- start:127 stop:1143 length:1017 start_codon:yes stop_codon:yes gene_type:complete